MKLFTVCFGTQHTAAEAAIAAKYDLLIVNQNTSTVAKAWYDSIKVLNPNIKLLAYLIVNHEPGTAPGAGNDILRDANRWNAVQQEPWLLTAEGYIKAIQLDGWKSRRLYDYEKAIWKENFKLACDAIFAAYPFDGLFLDNCTANWAAYAPRVVEKTTALQTALLDLRRAYPSKWIVGNGMENWMGLNGEMNEGRLGQVSELTPVTGQVVPNVNCFLSITTASTPNTDLQTAYNAVKPYGAWYGVQRNDNVLYWPSLFDTIEA